MKRIETRFEMLGGFDVVAALFEGLQPEEYRYTSNGREHHEIRVYGQDQDGKHLIGWTKYITPSSNGDGSFVPYLGYGSGYKDPLTPQLREEYPNVGRDLMLWVRKNAPSPVYADFMNERLEQATKAEYNPSTGYSVIRTAWFQSR